MPEDAKAEQYLDALLFALTNERTEQDFEDYRIDTPIYRDRDLYPDWDEIVTGIKTGGRVLDRGNTHVMEIHQIPLMVIPYFFEYMTWNKKLREEYPDQEPGLPVSNVLGLGLGSRLSPWLFLNYKYGLDCWRGGETLRVWVAELSTQLYREGDHTVNMLIVSDIILAVKYPYKFCQMTKDGFADHTYCVDDLVHDHTAVRSVWRYHISTSREIYEFEKARGESLSKIKGD